MHLMIDLETMSNRPNAAIVQIGAVQFDPNDAQAKLGAPSPFGRYVDITSAIAAGSHVSGDTLMWWLAQNDKARSALADGQAKAVPLSNALMDLIAWCPKERIYVWSHGAGFDVPIVEVAMSRFNLKPPWRFWDVRDTRTLFCIAGKDLKSLGGARDGIHHDAVDDAMYQAKAVCEAFKLLKVKAE